VSVNPNLPPESRHLEPPSDEASPDTQPTDDTTSPSEPPETRYSVVADDTLQNIAQRFSVSRGAIWDANREVLREASRSDGDVLTVGTVLEIPR